MKIGVIGSGTMGTGLVQLFAQANFIETVHWVYRSHDTFSSSDQALMAKWQHLSNQKKFTYAEVENFKSKIKRTSDYSLLEGLDFVIEAVTENVDVKKDVFRKASDHIESYTIFATNTSSISITEIASVAKFKQNIVGLHFFNPAPIMLLNEVVSGVFTSEATRSFVFELSIKLGKNPVLVNESPGFIVNRMLIPMINEAIGVLAEGVAEAADIDAAMMNGANHPIGPLSLADMIGNDVCLSIMEVLYKETGDPKYRAHPLLRKMVRANKLGRKTRFGFFDYTS